MSKRKEEHRGRPITCRYCGHKFKVNDKEKRQKWIDSSFPCPSCHTPYCFLTETEKDLQIIQEKYKKSGKDHKYIDEMHKILVPYAENIIKKYYINLFQDKSLLNYYAESAVSLLIESDFFKKEDFYIDTSFGSRLIKKCLQAIRGKKESLEANNEEDSLDWVFDDNHSVTSMYADKSKSLLESVEEQEEKVLLCEKICSLLFELGSDLTQREDYIRLINIYNYLEGGERAVDKFFDPEVYGRYGKWETVESLKIVRNEIEKIVDKVDDSKMQVRHIEEKDLTHNEIMTSKFKDKNNKTWQKVLLSSKDPDGSYYFINAQWRDPLYFKDLKIKRVVE